MHYGRVAESRQRTSKNEENRMKLNRKVLGAALLVGAAVVLLFTGCGNPLVATSDRAAPDTGESRALAAFNYTNDWSENNGNASGAGVSISGSGFSYTADWSGKDIQQGWCYGKGWKTGIPAAVNFTLSYTASQGGCVGIYGWLQSNDASYPYTEFYITEGSGSVEGCYNNDNDGNYSPNGGAKPDLVGTYTQDGATYTLYKHVRKGKPSPGSSNFMQWIAVRGDGKAVRTSGTVSINSHLSSMASLMGKTIVTREDSSSNPKYWTVFTIEGWVSPKQNTKDPNNNNVLMNPDGVGATTNTGKATLTLSEATAPGKTWTPITTGMDSEISALAVNSSSALFAGGAFSSAGGYPAKRVAKYSYGAWNALGNGLPGWCDSIVTTGSLIYASAYDTTVSPPVPRVMKYSYGSWSDMGAKMDKYTDVYKLALDSSNNLYAGGSFTSVNGAKAYGIAKWNKTSWSALTPQTGSGPAYVRGIALDAAGNVYAGCAVTFSAADGTANYIARWDGNSFYTLGTGLDGQVDDLVYDSAKNVVYAAGWFKNAGGKSANLVAKWDCAAKAWSALKGGLTGTYVNDLVLDKAGNLYAIGSFYSADGVSVNGIAMWNGSAWSAVGTGYNGGTTTMAYDSATDTLYAAGGTLLYMYK
jgi:hypothetical protein